MTFQKQNASTALASRNEVTSGISPPVSEFLLPDRMRDLLIRLQQQLLDPCRKALVTCDATHQKTHAGLARRETEIARSRREAQEESASIERAIQDLLAAMRLQYGQAIEHCQELGARLPPVTPHLTGEQAQNSITRTSEVVEFFPLAEAHRAETQRLLENVQSLGVEPNPLCLSNKNQRYGIYFVSLVAAFICTIGAGQPLSRYGCLAAFLVPLGSATLTYLCIMGLVYWSKKVEARIRAANLRRAIEAAQDIVPPWRSSAKERLDRKLAEIAIAEQEHSAAVDAERESYCKALDDVRARFSPIVSQLQNEFRSFTLLCMSAGSDWHDSSWQTWYPDESPEFAARIGRVVVDADDLRGRFPDVDFRFELPALVPFATGKCLMFCVDTQSHAPKGNPARPLSLQELGTPSFTVVLIKPGDRLIQVIKEIRSATLLGLKEAKELVDNTPKPVKSHLHKVEAEALKKALEAVGAVAAIEVCTG
jgi:ribosomal protein L7/L12